MNLEVNGIIKPGQIISPRVVAEDIPKLVKKWYGMVTQTVIQFNGYDDKNFFVKVCSLIGDVNPYIREVFDTGYIFKVMNSEDSKHEDIIKAQHKLMDYISHSDIGICIPSLITNVNGELFALENLRHDGSDKALAMHQRHVVRMLKYIPGKLMKEVEYTKQLLFEVGKLTGKLNSILKNFKNSAIENKRTIWQLGSMPLLRDFLYAVQEEEKRDLFEEILKSFEDVVLPAIASLEKGIVHGDLNEQNILVSSDCHIIGLLDFGDVNYSPLVFELAIAITYVILEVTTVDPNESASYVIAGYETERKITEKEWHVLRECVGGRIIQSLILGAYSYMYNPENDYVLCTAKIGWERLLNFWSFPKDRLLTKWKQLSSSYVV